MFESESRNTVQQVKQPVTMNRSRVLELLTQSKPLLMERNCARILNRKLCMSEAAQRAWWFYLDDMIACVEKVMTYTNGLDRAAFVASGLHYDATVRNPELIGEAATHIPDKVHNENPQIPWRLIIATRNRLIHGYLGIDNDTLWSVIQDDIPALLPQLRVLRNQSLVDFD
jgi:uncharacterized protein with HEPN domain